MIKTQATCFNNPYLPIRTEDQIIAKNINMFRTRDFYIGFSCEPNKSSLTETYIVRVDNGSGEIIGPYRHIPTKEVQLAISQSGVVIVHDEGSLSDYAKKIFFNSIAKYNSELLRTRALPIAI